jgi:predicted DNA binding CopG/RHH family protein
MPKNDAYDKDILGAYEKGQLKSVATKAELAKLKAAARATAVKDRRVNIRLSSSDLQDVQVKAMQEGVPYQTLIASVLHKYVTGRLTEPQSSTPEKTSKSKAQS